MTAKRAVCVLVLAFSCLFLFQSCRKGPDKGVGPVKEVQLGPLDKSLAEKGGKIFETKCGSCHKMDQRYVGPPLRNITKIETPEFIMNQILDPDDMIEKDPKIHQLYAQYMTKMANQHLSQDDARAVLEYLRREAEEKK